MAAQATFTTQDGIGLGVAVAAHVALAAALALHVASEPEPLAPPQRIDVSLVSEVSLESTAPDPSAQPAASIAPEIAEIPAPPSPEVVEQPAPPRVQPTTPPPPRRTTPSPRATSTPAPAPSPRATQRPAPTPSPTAAQRTGGSRLGENFLGGESNANGNTGTPAATFGRAERASLASAITRQLRPHWSAPSGVDVDQLVSVVSWRLNQDGTLRGRPSCTSQRGINDSNRPQAALHCERAVRAVQLAAPFNLPDQFYTHWDDLEWEFDRRL